MRLDQQASRSHGCSYLPKPPQSHPRRVVKATTFDNRNRLLLFASLISLLCTGCRGRAQQEVYDAQMAHEIRVLEDQLYEADYQNRVLVDQIESLKLKGAAPFYQPNPNDPSTLGRPSIPDPVRNPGAQPSPNRPMTDDPLIDALDDLDAMIDEGKEEPLMPAPPSIKELNAPPATAPNSEAPLNQNDQAPADRQPREDNRLGLLPYSASERARIYETDNDLDGNSTRSTPLLAAPGGPEPPGMNSLVAPPIVQGEMLPPPGKEPEAPMPPGQIILPQSHQVPLPHDLKLHPSLSGGYKHEGEVQQMMLVVNVLDQSGRPLELADYDINANLSVVLFDGDQEQSTATKLGRWDFEPQQVLQFVKDAPISGFHIPIDWKDLQPSREMIHAHVRLRSEADEMRCDGLVKVSSENAVAKWAPRGSDPR